MSWSLWYAEGNHPNNKPETQASSWPGANKKPSTEGLAEEKACPFPSVKTAFFSVYLLTLLSDLQEQEQQRNL